MTNKLIIIPTDISHYSKKKSFKTADVRKAIATYTGKNETDKEVQQLIKNVRRP